MHTLIRASRPAARPFAPRSAARFAAALAVAAAFALAAGAAAAAQLVATSFPSAQAALDAAHDGDRVYFPAGRYPVPPGGLVIDKGLEIFGDGVDNVAGTGTVFVHSAPKDSSSILVIRTAPGGTVGPSSVYLHDFRIQDVRPRRPVGRGLGHGIYCWQDGTRSHGNVSDLRIEHVTIAGVAMDGIHLEGAPDGNDAIVLGTIRECHIVECGRHGIYANTCVLQTIFGGYVHECGGCGVFAESSPAFVVDHLSLEHNQLVDAALDPAHEAQFRLRMCHGFRLSTPYAERFAGVGGAATTAVSVENCWSGVIEGGVFSVAVAIPGTRGIALDAGTNGVEIGANVFDLVDSMVVLANTASCSNNVVFPQTAMRQAAGLAYAVSVGGQANGNFVFDYSAATRTTFPRAGGGIVLPTAGAPASGRAGALYCDPGTRTLQFNDGSAWKVVQSSR